MWLIPFGIAAVLGWHALKSIRDSRFHFGLMIGGEVNLQGTVAIITASFLLVGSLVVMVSYVFTQLFGLDEGRIVYIGIGLILTGFGLAYLIQRRQ